MPKLGALSSEATLLQIERAQPLRRRTSLRLGGAAELLAEVHHEAHLAQALRFAQDAGLAVTVLGGGTNLVVADEGISGLTVCISVPRIRYTTRGDQVLVRAGAGVLFDALVQDTVSHDLSGLECLSGIPGRVGATPVQNVGAYGCEVAERIACVEVYEPARGAARPWTAAECVFGYRDSRFRREPGKYMVLAVTFALSPGGRPQVGYGDLQRALTGAAEVNPRTVRHAVLCLRREKAMLLEPEVVESRSVGSFFKNPVMTEQEANALQALARRHGGRADAEAMPRFFAGPSRTKVPAAWLIERAGFPKGTRRGPVGISSRHALSLVHYGRGRTADLLQLATDVQRAVMNRFGVCLLPEPVFAGFRVPPLRGAVLATTWP